MKVNRKGITIIVFLLICCNSSKENSFTVNDEIVKIVIHEPFNNANPANYNYHTTKSMEIFENNVKLIEEIYKNGNFSEKIIKNTISAKGKDLFLAIPKKYIDHYSKYKFLNYPENFLDDGAGFTSIKIVRKNDAIMWKIRWEELPQDLNFLQKFYKETIVKLQKTNHKINK